MNIEEMVRDHYAQLRDDDGSENRLRDLIDGLARTPSEPPASRRHTSVVLGLSVAAVALAVAIAVALFSRSGDHSQVGPAAGPSPSTSPAGPSHLPGYVAVAGSSGQTGQVKESDMRDVQLNPKNPAEALRWQRARGDISAVLPMYAADGQTVIGEWTGFGDGKVVSTSCANHDGLGFTITPPGDDHGAASPIGAAQQLSQHVGLASFGTTESRWTVTSETATGAVVATGSVTLHASQLGNDTWVIDRGQRCNT